MRNCKLLLTKYFNTAPILSILKWWPTLAILPNRRKAGASRLGTLFLDVRVEEFEHTITSIRQLSLLVLLLVLSSTVSNQHSRTVTAITTDVHHFPLV